MEKAKVARVKPRKSEAEVRRLCIAQARREGWYHIRLHFGPGAARGVPDDLFIRDGRHLFIEFKAEGKASNTSPSQQFVHGLLRAHGADVRVVDNVVAFRCATLRL
jgi:hypothetical protein